MGEPTATEIHKMEQMAEDLLRRASSQAERDALAEAKRGIHGWKSEVAAGRSGTSFQKLAQEWIFKAGEARRAAAKGGIPSMGKIPTAEELHETIHGGAPVTEEELKEIEGQPNPADVMAEAKVIQFEAAQGPHGRFVKLDDAILQAKERFKERPGRGRFTALFNIAPKRDLGEGAQSELQALITAAERVPNPSPNLRAEVARAKAASADLQGTLDIAVAPEDMSILERATGEARRAADDLLKVLPASVRSAITGAGLGVIRDGKALLLDVKTRAQFAKAKMPASMTAPASRLDAAIANVEKTAAVVAGAPAGGKVRAAAIEKMGEELREVGNATAALQDARDLEIAAGHLPNIEIATVRVNPLSTPNETLNRLAFDIETQFGEGLNTEPRLSVVRDRLRDARFFARTGRQAALEKAVKKLVLAVAEVQGTRQGFANALRSMKEWARFHPKAAKIVGFGAPALAWAGIELYLRLPMLLSGSLAIFERAKNLTFIQPRFDKDSVDITQTSDVEFMMLMMDARASIESLQRARDAALEFSNSWWRITHPMITNPVRAYLDTADTQIGHSRFVVWQMITARLKEVHDLGGSDESAIQALQAQTSKELIDAWVQSGTLKPEVRDTMVDILERDRLNILAGAEPGGDPADLAGQEDAVLKKAREKLGLK